MSLKSIVCFSAAAATGGSVLNVAALLASGTQVTPQIAMAAQMAALQAKALAETGIAVPSYYNPAAVNPMKFAEQEKKRKMLWQGKKEGVSSCVLVSSPLANGCMKQIGMKAVVSKRRFIMVRFATIKTVCVSVQLRKKI